MFNHFRFAAASVAVILGVGLVAPSTVGAATATGVLDVTASVTNACSVSASTADFGSYAFAAASTTTSTITVTCTTGTAVASVGLDNGLQPAAGVRQLKSSGVPTIPYGLYQDAGHVTAWTNAAFPAATTYTAVSTPSTFTVYAKAPSGANVAAGTYTDVVGITVTYT